MNRQHMDQLYDIGKILYKEKDLPIQKTCMCWGFQCPDTWFQVLKELSKKIEYINLQNFGKLEIIAKQVKQKYGQLRFYYQINCKQDDISDEEYNKIKNEVELLIKRAEIQIYNICVVCGGKATKTSKGYILRYCQKCIENMKDM